MNKTFLTTLFCVLLLTFSGMAQAGERSHNRGYQSYGYSGSSSHYRGPSRNHYAGRHYNRHIGFAPNYYRHHSSRHAVHNGLEVVAGALVLGSIIHAVNNSHRERVVYRTVTPVNRGEYWYRIDGDGRCVEVRMNSRGQEVWTYTDPNYCN